jgi:hypothetical protein
LLLTRIRNERFLLQPRQVSSGTDKCTNSGYELQVGSTKHLPPCPSCKNGEYYTVTRGDAQDDPYPDR